MIKKLLWCGGVLLTAFSAQSQSTVELNPDKDNSIYSESLNSNGAGRLYAGQNCDDQSRRAFLHFDIASMVPFGAVITDVTLTLNVDESGGTAADYTLRRSAKDWGEGASLGTDAGATAMAPDATWEESHFSLLPWTFLGGDYYVVPSATTTLPGAIGDYDWTSAGLVADVQFWLDNPEFNFGWALVGNEGVVCAMNTFGSKDLGTAPILSITYTCVAGAPNAVCQSVNAYIDDSGIAMILDGDLDGGSTAYCGELVSFDATATTFSCDDIFTGTVSPSLVISAAYDATLPGGTPKGIELYAINDIPDLSIYGIGSANNGGGTDGEEFTFPAVSLAAGSFIYVSTDSLRFQQWFGFYPDYNSGSMSINGDDAVELFMDGTVIDVFGEIDTDGSGEPWEYLDGWAYRVSNTGPDGSTFDISNWTFSGRNEWDGDMSNATAIMPIAVGSYIQPPTNGVSVTLTVIALDGMTDVCTATVMVFDTLAPTMVCVGELTYVLDETGTMTIDVSDLDAGTTDGCGIDSLWLSQYDFNCSNEGENEIQLYAVDVYGNVDSCAVTITIDGTEVITILEEVLTDPLCAGSADGSIDIAVTGGTADYIFDWDNDGTGDADDTEDLAGLSAGTYEVIVEDDNGCKVVASFDLVDPEAITITFEQEDESCNNSVDGAINITVSGGTPDYTFAWTKEGDADFTPTTEDLTGLSNGDYVVTVLDANGCTNSAAIEVLLSDPIDTTLFYSGEEGGIVIHANHDGAASYQWVKCPDYTIYEGKTEQDLLPEFEEGEYFACIITTEGGCVDTTECVLYIYEGIEENRNKFAVELYPNPTTGNLTIKLDASTQEYQLTVISANGKVILERKMEESEEMIDLSNLSDGVYFIQLKTDDAVVTKRITLSK